MACGGDAPLDATAQPSAPAPAEDAAQLPAPSSGPERPEPRSAQSGGDGDGRGASRKSDGQTTAAPPPGQEDDPVAKLTPDQRRRILAEADPEEVVMVNDRVGGYLGKRKQVEDAEAAQQQLRALRDKAVREGDQAAALQYTQASTAQEYQAAGDQAWGRAVGTFTALLDDPRTAPLVEKIKGKDYEALGRSAGVPEHALGLWASQMFKLDMTDLVDELPAKLPEWENAIRRDHEAKIRPAIEREVRAKLLGEELPPDVGTGAPPASDDLPANLPAFKAYVARMSAAEYARREGEIDRHLDSLLKRRQPAARR